MGLEYLKTLYSCEKLISHGIDYKMSYTGNYMNKMDAEAFALERGEIEIADYLNSLK